MSLWTLNLIFKNSLLFKEIKYFNMIWALIGAIQLIYLNSLTLQKYDVQQIRTQVTVFLTSQRKYYILVSINQDQP